MPTYEYECKDCGHRFEQFQSMSAAPLKKCPECGKEIRRLIGTGAGFIFKGSGFHANDYKGSSCGIGAGGGASCNMEGTCCGRDTPCSKSPRKV